METLLTEFAFLTDQALQGKNIDPSIIENLTKLFDVEAYKAWAQLELEPESETEKAQNLVKESEDYLECVMESAMSEFYLFEEEEMNKAARGEHDDLVRVGDRVRRFGVSLEKAASFALKKYIDAAVNSASASMRYAFKAVSKVHPS